MQMHPDYPYLYETHLHTSQGSACGKYTGREMAIAAKAAGYTGIFVTDHHMGGNTRPDRSLPWTTWVEAFSEGYRDAKAAGDEVGLQVFYGWESGFRATEFLIYGLSEDWMKAHPELAVCSVEEQYRLVHEAGGMVIHAHPYREAPYIPEIRLFPDAVDGVEGINAQHSNDTYCRSHYDPAFNDKAIAYARKTELPMTAGSDVHHTDRMVGGGVAFPEPLTDPQDYIRRILSGTGYLLTDGLFWYDAGGNNIGPVLP